MPCEFAPPMTPREVEICRHCLRGSLSKRLARGTYDAGGHTEHERVRRNDHPLSAHGTGANDRAAPDDDVIEHDRAHGDETVILDRGAMHDRAMSDRNASTDRARQSRVDVNDDAVLHVARLADHDRRGVRAKYRLGPHGCAGPERHIAADERVRMDERVRVDACVAHRPLPRARKYASS